MDNFRDANILSKQLYEEYREEYGRLIRLVIGLSAGAVTIVCAVLGDPAKASGLLIFSLIFHLVSLACGLTIQYLLMRDPKKFLEQYTEKWSREPSPINQPLFGALPKLIDRPFNITLLVFQLWTFWLATFFIVIHFLLESFVSNPPNGA